MSSLTRSTGLRVRCGCGIKAYSDEASAERALERVQARALRDVMPKRVVQCWRGQWHLKGTRPVGTGPDKNTRARVKERDDWSCAACRTPVGDWHSIQHRVARGRDGTTDPAISSPANLVLLCGSATSPGCHLKCERRDRGMNERGFWLESWQDPRLFPVDHALYGWAYLREDGSVQPLRPTGGAA
jgi:5-methylcytosine-specific restriction protein A